MVKELLFLQLRILSPQDMHNQCVGMLALLSADRTVHKKYPLQGFSGIRFIHYMRKRTGAVAGLQKAAPECCHDGAGPIVIFLIQNGAQDRLAPFTPLPMIALQTFGAPLARQKALLQLPDGGGDDIVGGGEVQRRQPQLLHLTEELGVHLPRDYIWGMRRPLSRASCIFATSSSILLIKSSSK
jgi:hypothetical protein